MFLYKEEEGGLENRIEQWWQRIRDLHAHAISRETAFLKVVADVTSKGFAKLFGKRLLGLKAVAASICYSQAAVCLFITILVFRPGILYSYSPTRREVAIHLTWGTLCLFFISLGSLGAFIERESRKRLWLLSVLIAAASWPIPFVVIFFPVAEYKDDVWSGMYLFGLAIIFVSVICDFFFIALTRLMLLRAAQSNSFLQIAALAIGNACIAALFFIGPLVGGSWFISTPLKGWPDIPQMVLMFVGASNSLDALVSLSWFLIAIMMLLHRVFWPLIERPVYALFRHRVFSEQKKLVFFSGIALIGFAIPAVGHVLENLVKAVHA